MFLCDVGLVIKICYKNMTTTINAENLRQYKSRVFLVIEQILVFALNTNLIMEVENLPPNFKPIA